MLRLIIVLVFLVFLIFQTGCASYEFTQSHGGQKPSSRSGDTLIITIDSYANENVPSGIRYILLPYDSSLFSNYLQYEQFSFQVHKFLKFMGYSPASTYDSASVIIFFKYGSTDRQVFEREVYAPIYSQTGIASYQTFQGPLSYYPFSTSISNIISSTLTEVPYRSTSYFYTHFLILSAFDKQTMEINFPRSLRWKILSKSDVGDRDSRKWFPYLLIASENYIGKDSRQEVNVQLNSNDRRYYWLVNNLPDAYLNPGSSISIQKSLTPDEVKINDLKQFKEISSFEKILDFSELTPEQSVMFKSELGEIIYGVVKEAKSPEAISIAVYPKIGQKQLVVCRLFELYRIKEFLRK